MIKGKWTFERSIQSIFCSDSPWRYLHLFLKGFKRWTAWCCSFCIIFLPCFASSALSTYFDSSWLFSWPFWHQQDGCQEPGSGQHKKTSWGLFPQKYPCLQSRKPWQRIIKTHYSNRIMTTYWKFLVYYLTVCFTILPLCKLWVSLYAMESYLISLDT